MDERVTDPTELKTEILRPRFGLFVLTELDQHGI
jgi:hypothetical protein